MYCIKCGVELAGGEKKCPLCGLVAYHPELGEPSELPDKPFPEYKRSAERVSRFGAMFVTTLVFLLPTIITLLCDIGINSAVTWSVIAVGALVLAYIVTVLPFWFRRRNPVIFVPVDFAVCALFLLLIERYFGGKWFLGFALPVVAGVCAIVTAGVTLVRYVRRGKLYIYGGASIATGLLIVLMEWLISLNFGIGKGVFWSLYPLTVLVIIGLIFIVIAICRPLRETLYKKFFI